MTTHALLAATAFAVALAPLQPLPRGGKELPVAQTSSDCTMQAHVYLLSRSATHCKPRECRGGIVTTTHPFLANAVEATGVLFNPSGHPRCQFKVTTAPAENGRTCATLFACGVSDSACSP
jgi:hypothetical protein